MYEAVGYPKTIKVLEEMMLEYETTITDTNWDKPDWRIPYRKGNRNWKDKKTIKIEETAPTKTTTINWADPVAESQNGTATQQTVDEEPTKKNQRHSKPDKRGNNTERKENTDEMEQKLLGNIRQLMENWTESENHGELQLG